MERSFGTAQDRWVKELRLANAKTCVEANAVLEKLVPEHNRRFAKPARQQPDAHRRLGPGHRLESILSIQSERVVSNDYVVRFENQFFQLLPPVRPGERGGRVVIEERLDGTMAIRFGSHYLKYRELTEDVKLEFNAGAADARDAKEKRGSCEEPRSRGMQPTAGCSGRTPAEPYPPGGDAGDNGSRTRRPAKNHPWRKSLK